MTANRVRTKLVVPSADRALEWYQQALGAEVVDRSEIDGSVVFAAFTVLGTTLTIKDADAVDPQPEHLILDITTDDADPVWHGMVEAGAEVVFPIDDQFYGQRGGRLRDPFGVQWIVSGPLSSDRA